MLYRSKCSWVFILELKQKFQSYYQWQSYEILNVVDQSDQLASIRFLFLIFCRWQPCMMNLLSRNSNQKLCSNKFVTFCSQESFLFLFSITEILRIYFDYLIFLQMNLIFFTNYLKIFSKKKIRKKINFENWNGWLKSFTESGIWLTFSCCCCFFFVDKIQKTKQYFCFHH